MKLDKDSLQIDYGYCNRLNFHDYDQSYPDKETQVMVLGWGCNLGFGEYAFYFEDRGKGIEIIADSEHMDKGENKEFLKALMEKFVEKVEIED